MGRPNHDSVKDYFALADQTEGLRAMLATHKESRSIAVDLFPDELRLDAGSGDAVVRFNKARDVVYLHDYDAFKKYHLPGFATEVEHVAVAHRSPPVAALAKRLLPNLKRIYLCSTTDDLKRRNIAWCGSDYVHRYVVQTFRKEVGLGEDTEVLYCWPDVDRHPDFAKYSIPKFESPDILEAAKDAAVMVLPMVEFEFERGMELMEKLRRMKDVPVLHDGEDDSDETETDEDASQEGTDLDEYESEGIDDEEIEGQDESSEDEIIPLGDVGRFSSLEDSADEVVEVSAPVQRSRKRKVVSDSEDEEPQTKRMRARVIVDSDDEDGEAEKRTGNTRAISVSDEDSEPQQRTRNTRAISVSDESDEVGIVQVRSKGKPRRAVASESEEAEDSDGSEGGSEDGTDEEEEDGDDDEGPKWPSLAERLKIAREENPVSSDGEEDSESDDSEDDDDAGGLLDVMAEDEEEDDEDEEAEDEWYT
jgi:hypothetical protein